MDDAVAHGETVGPCRKLWHAFEWFQSFAIVVGYVVTAVVLVENWLITRDIQFQKGFALNGYYAKSNAQDALSHAYNVTSLPYRARPKFTLQDCLDLYYKSNTGINGTYDKECVQYERDLSAHEQSESKEAYESKCKCMKESYENPCQTMYQLYFTFNVDDSVLRTHDPRGDPFAPTDGVFLLLYMRAKGGYENKIDLVNDTACFGKLEEVDSDVFLPFATVCSICTLASGAMLLAFLECSGSFAPKDHELHTFEMKFKNKLRYFLIEFKDQKGKQPCWAKRSKTTQDVFLSVMQYFFTTMIYNCMLAVFTKPGGNLMGNDDAVFNANGQLYAGPGLWYPSAPNFVIMMLMGAYTFLIFLVLLMTPCSIIDSIRARRLVVNAPVGPWLFIIANILTVALVLNQSISYVVAVASGTFPALHISDFIFGISLNWETLTFFVPDVQFPVAVAVMTIGSLKLSLLISRTFVRCKLRDIRKLARVEPGRGGVERQAENGTIETAAADTAEAIAVKMTREKIIAVADKKYTTTAANRGEKPSEKGRTNANVE